MKKLIIVAIAVLCVACNQPPGGQGAGSDASGSNAVSGAAGSGDERFYGREQFTLVGNQSGTESGTFTEHVRDWGRTRAEIKDVTLSTMGITRRTNTRAVYNGPEIATVDLESGNVTVIVASGATLLACLGGSIWMSSHGIVVLSTVSLKVSISL